MLGIDVREQVTVTFTGAGVERVIKHNQGTIPPGFLVAELSTDAIIYGDRSGTNVTKWTNRFMYLKADKACVARILVLSGGN